jgi:hypothetical protein
MRHESELGQVNDQPSSVRPAIDNVHVSVSLSKETKRSLWIGFMLTAILTVATLGSAPWWWHLAFPPSQAPAAPASEVVGMSGGCAPFQVFAQNRWQPYGAAIRAQPNVLSQLVGTDPGNFSLSVDGWVYGRVPYPTNTPPWNSNLWYHLTDGAGWVSFAGVRATPSIEDPTGLSKYGGNPAPMATSCEGAVN